MRLLLLLIVSSCSIGLGVNQRLINGEIIYEAKCNGTRRTYADCFELASNKCLEINKISFVLNKDHTSSFGTINKQLVSIENRSILFKCVEE